MPPILPPALPPRRRFLSLAGGSALGALGLSAVPEVRLFAQQAQDFIAGPKVPDVPPHVKLLCTTGFLGGLTTFSSFSGEVFSLFQRGDTMWAFVAVAAHVIGSLAMTALGWWMWQRLAV